MHSMKTTMLAAAAQLALPREDRLAQGHHRDSARLYSRNDTYDSLRVQRRLATQLAHGWRPNCSMARGGGAPVPHSVFPARHRQSTSQSWTCMAAPGHALILAMSPCKPQPAHCPHLPLPPYRPTQTAKQKPSRHTPRCTATRVKRKHSTVTDSLNVSSLSAMGRGPAVTEPQRTRRRSIGPVSLLRLHSSARAAAPSSALQPQLFGLPLRQIDAGEKGALKTNLGSCTACMCFLTRLRPSHATRSAAAFCPLCLHAQHWISQPLLAQAWTFSEAWP